MKRFFARWSTFVSERFSLPAHLPLVLIFYLGNILAFYALTGGAMWDYPLKTLVIGPFLTLLIFFHMRLFDEVKDYRHDVQFNSGRPLPRGLVTVHETNRVTIGVIVFEIVLAILAGREVLTAYLVLLGFTILMRYEFFIGGWLRPRLELYALSHTFSAFFLGLMIYFITSDRPVCCPGMPVVVFCLGNWFVFNLYEFSRKTFAQGEEPASGDSYSARLGAASAAALSGGNVFLACLCVVWVFWGKVGQFRWLIPVAAALMPVLAGIWYALGPAGKRARAFRNWSGAYLLIHYVVVMVINLF